MPTIKRTDFMCGVVVISLALYLNMNCAFAFNCQNYIGLPIIDKTIRALGLRQMIQPHDISTEDAFAKTLIEMARPFVDGKARIVFLRYRKGGLGSNAVYDDLLLYKRDIGEDWKNKPFWDLFPASASGTWLAFPSDSEQITAIFAGKNVEEEVRLYCYEEN